MTQPLVEPAQALQGRCCHCGLDDACRRGPEAVAQELRPPDCSAADSHPEDRTHAGRIRKAGYGICRSPRSIYQPGCAQESNPIGTETPTDRSCVALSTNPTAMARTTCAAGTLQVPCAFCPAHKGEKSPLPRFSAAARKGASAFTAVGN